MKEGSSYSGRKTKLLFIHKGIVPIMLEYLETGAALRIHGVIVGLGRDEKEAIQHAAFRLHEAAQNLENYASGKPVITQPDNLHVLK